MKKRILAVLLMVVILAALFAGLSVTAAAENDISGDSISGYVIAYTLAKDDTVLKVCNKLGIDFYKNQALITKINNIADYSKLPVGKVVWLPATSVGSAKDYYTLKSHKVVSGDNVNTLLTKYGIASTDTMLSRVNNNLASPTVGSTLTFPVYTGDSTAKMADTTAAAIGGTATAAAATGISTTTGTTAVTSGNVAYYLMAYTMQPGDTVGAVCTANGINFNQNSALISRINGITNYNRIPVGRTIMIPTGTPTGASYSVVAHQIQGGETANDICASYGTSLANNLTLVKGLNNTNNLNYIQAGGILYVPVLGASGGGGGGEGGGGGGGDITPTPSALGTYKLSKDDCDNGSFVLKVDGVEATTAVEGKTVTIVCTGKGAYVQKTVVAHMTGDTTKVVKVTNNTFVMPDYNVTVSVTFGKATNYSLKCTPSTNGSYELYVDEALISSQTYGGAVVTVKPKPASGYTLDTIKVYKTGDDTVTTEVANNKFTMPPYNATIEVTFKASAAYEYPLVTSGATNGSFELKIGSAVVTKAASGKTVTVAYKANKNYKLDFIKISYPVWNEESEATETKEVLVSGAKFNMPKFNDNIALSDRKVTVTVEFIKSAVYNITLKSDSNGNTVVAHLNDVHGTSVTKAEEGRTLILMPKVNKGNYEISKITVKNEKTGVTKTYNYSDLIADASYLMPASDITVTPTFVAPTAHSIKWTASPTGYGSAVFTVKAAVATSAKREETVNMEITPANINIQLKSVKAEYKYNGEIMEATITGNNFTMPPYDVEVTGTFEVVRNKVTMAANSNVSSINYTVNSQTVADGGRAATGDNVVINVTMKSGYAVKEIKVTYVDSKGKTQEVPVTNNVFVMPAYDATVTITEEVTDGSYKVTVIDTSNGTAKVVDQDKPSITKTKANKDDKLQVVCEPSTYYEIDTVEYRKEGASSWTTLSSPYNITMPEGNIEVKATFKGKIFALSKIDTTGVGEIIITDKNDNEITEARYGDTVKVVATAKTGYKLVKVEAKNKDTGIVYATGNSFTMPAFNVEVEAVFTELKKNLALTAEIAPPVTGGEFTLQVGGADVNVADEGKTVTINATLYDGYSIKSVTVKTASGKDVSVSEYSFKMPDEAVTVTVAFEKNG